MRLFNLSLLDTSSGSAWCFLFLSSFASCVLRFFCGLVLTVLSIPSSWSPGSLEPDCSYVVLDLTRLIFHVLFSSAVQCVGFLCSLLLILFSVPNIRESWTLPEPSNCKTRSLVLFSSYSRSAIENELDQRFSAIYFHCALCMHSSTHFFP